MVSVLLVDDHAVMRQGIKCLLESWRRPIDIDEAGCAIEALDKLRDHHWDAVIMDISMPGTHGIDLLKQFKRECPDVPVLVFSVHQEEEYGLRVLKAGAAGYVTKGSAPERLTEALEKTLAHQRYISPGLAEQLAEEFSSGHEHSRHHGLSDREFEVLRLIGSGATPKNIAGALSLNVKTVHTYRLRVLAKLGLKNNAQLIRYALDNDLLEE